MNIHAFRISNKKTYVVIESVKVIVQDVQQNKVCSKHTGVDHIHSALDTEMQDAENVDPMLTQPQLRMMKRMKLR